MAVSVGSIVLKVSDIGRAAAFWTAALGYTAQPDNPAYLSPEGGGGPMLHLDEDDRTHPDLRAGPADSDQQAEVERLVSLGATRVDWDYPHDANFVVLADTEGNLVCVIA
jgi:catechol 2,3-dioxygenase-like lactoylglutathione lyase family enzyme